MTIKSHKSTPKQFLRSLRVLRGLSQVELGRRIGKRSQPWVCRVEAGSVIPCPKEREKIAKLLGTSVDVLWPELSQDGGVR